VPKSAFGSVRPEWHDAGGSPSTRDRQAGSTVSGLLQDGRIVGEECCDRYRFSFPLAQKVKDCGERRLGNTRGGMIPTEQGCHGILC
jgi:hypothetical protein